MPAEVVVLPLHQANKYGRGKNTAVVSTVSTFGGWSKELSPFCLGPVDLYDGYESCNVENGWQYSKVYTEFYEKGRLLDGYFDWAMSGWENERAVRYPMGKGVKPLFSYWDGECLDYVTARKVIYGPLYTKAVAKTEAWDKLFRLYSTHKRLVLLDYDAYDHREAGMTLTEVLNDPNRKMGHGFLLAMMLTEDKALSRLETGNGR